MNMGTEPYDVVVVGGGINGAGIARDAAGRGLRVLLSEQDDLAAHTSSASTKLIHGGLRYLESYEFGLVRKSLKEREILLRAAPHIIWPLRFVMPHTRDLRPRWLIRLGLFLYDRLGGPTSLPRSGAIKLHRDVAGEPLRTEFTDGYAYSDCWVQDSRLVVLNARDAARLGADVRPRTACTGARRENGCWRVELQAADGTASETVTARSLVNAAGPWVDSLRQRIGGNAGVVQHQQLRRVKGSHIVVPRMFAHAHAYLLQNTDGRVIFVIPYEQDYTLIGTTDEPFAGDAAEAAITPLEIDYLCTIVSRYFRQPVHAADVVWSYAGVRALYDDDASASASTGTRDYVLAVEGGVGEAPLVSIYGGKLTTYRILADDVLARLAQPLGVTQASWTAHAPLPGGDIPGADFATWLQRLRSQYPFLPADLLWRYARNYGTAIHDLVGEASALADLGEDCGDGIHGAELDYLVRHEWARTPDDVLWRRSRMGLHASAATRAAIAAWFEREARAAGEGQQVAGDNRG